MKKYIPFTILAFLVTIFALHKIADKDDQAIKVGTSNSESTQSTVPSPSSNISSDINKSNNTSSYKNGTYTGPVEDAYYGNVQIQTTISGGKITDVQFLSYPNDNGTSREINMQAMPLLKNEAISAQSPNVDTISGASFTSEAFIRSLKAALSQSS